jgi:A/G-specific adenine glycosylase
MLVLECEGQLWLQRRPASGIWGGLWSLPAFADRAGLETLCAGLPAPEGRHQALAAVEHVFTHFRLLMQPVRLRLAGPPPPIRDLQALAPPERDPGGARASRNPVAISVQAGESAWVPVAGLPELGMPAPLSRLLLALYQPEPDLG